MNNKIDGITHTKFTNSFNKSKEISESEWEKIIKKCFGNDCKIQWKNDKVSQLDFGCDVIITTKEGRKYSADVKTRNETYYNHPYWLLEISHCRYNNKINEKTESYIVGWLYKSTADFIIYATRNGNELIESCIFSIYPFKDEKFNEKIRSLKDVRDVITKFDNNIFQITKNKKIHQEMIKKYANFYWYWNYKKKQKKSLSLDDIEIDWDLSQFK